MFNWFKKTASTKKACTELDVSAIQGDETITQLAISESEALKNQGNAHLGNGKLEEAAECFRRAIEQNPRYAEAYTSLGFVFRLQGNQEEAVALCRKAVSINPNLLAAHLNLGVALMSLGHGDAAEESLRRVIVLATGQSAALQLSVALQSLGVIVAQRGDLPEAETLLRRALELQPDYAEAHYALGKLLQLANRLPEAEASYHRVLELQPDYAEVYYTLGNLLVKAKRLTEAEESYRCALELKPGYVETHYNLAVLLMEVNRLSEAEVSYRRALELKPDYIEAHNNLGNLLQQTNLTSEAEASYRRALELKPEYADVHTNLGNLLVKAKRLPEAERFYRRALELQPDNPDFHINMGNLLVKAKRMSEAETPYRRSLELHPDNAEAHSNLGVILQDIGRLDEADVSLRRALEIKPNFIEAHSNLIFTLDLMVGADTIFLQEERKRWDAAHAAHLHQQRIHSNIANPERRLRIGYVSADFKEHSASKVFGGMLTQYDRPQFDVFAYSNFNGKDDQFTVHFRQSVTAWRNIADLLDDVVTEMIRQDEIDILVDLSGHTEGNRLLVFARKPAPIQITAWGYATGTGMRAMDVFFADPVMVPPQEKQYFTEEVRYLPCVVGSFFNEPFPDVNELPSLSNEFITFGSLNRLGKATEETYRVWAEILLAVPRSRLFLKSGELNDTKTRDRVVRHFTKAGLASDRIIMQGRTPWHEHMQAYNQIDIAIDPFPHGGGVTALEGLMMGVPVINLRWPTAVGRVSASIMTALGLTDWIAETQTEYVELAIKKASDLQSLATLRRRLRGIFTSSVIGDQVAYTRAVEKEYRQLWQEWCTNSSIRGNRQHSA